MTKFTAVFEENEEMVKQLIEIQDELKVTNVLFDEENELYIPLYDFVLLEGFVQYSDDMEGSEEVDTTNENEVSDFLFCKHPEVYSKILLDWKGSVNQDYENMI